MRTLLFGQFLLERGIISAEQLKQALDYQRDNNRVIGDIALEMGFLDEKSISHIIERQRGDDKDFGSIALEENLLQPIELDNLLREQQRVHLRLGEILVKLEFINHWDLVNELVSFEEIRSVEDEEPEDGVDISENPSLNFLNVFSRVLPRMTRGVLLPGGFYPTIGMPESNVNFHIRLSGSVQMDVLVIIPDYEYEELSEAVVDSVNKDNEETDKKSFEQSLQKIMEVAGELFVKKLERAGLQEKLVEVNIIEDKQLEVMKNKAESSNCVDYFLISPPRHDGDLMQFNLGFLNR